MAEYNEEKLKQILENNKLFPFKILNVVKNDESFIIRVEDKKQTFAEYCRKNLPKKCKFKNNDEVYELEKFFINMDRNIKIVFVLKKDDVIEDIFSLYECENPELFANHYLDLTIDEVIKEDI